jgi:hypothetical protein
MSKRDIFYIFLDGLLLSWFLYEGGRWFAFIAGMLFVLILNKLFDWYLRRPRATL